MEIIINGGLLPAVNERPLLRRRVAPGIRVIVLMLVPIAVAGAIVAAMLTGTLAAPALGAQSGARTDSAPLAYCTTKAVHPVLYPTAQLDARC